MGFLVRQLAVGGFDHNFSYLITAENGDAALVDPTGDADVIRHAVESAGPIVPRYILLTHGHLDHRTSAPPGGGEAVGRGPADSSLRRWGNRGSFHARSQSRFRLLPADRRLRALHRRHLVCRMCRFLPFPGDVPVAADENSAALRPADHLFRARLRTGSLPHARRGETGEPFFAGEFSGGVPGRAAET